MVRTILILEDDALLRRQLELLFTRRGYRVRVAGSVAAFIATAVTERFDACLMDLSLPDGDGLDGWERVRLTQQGAVAVAMTAYGTPEAERRAAALGVRAVLPKPLDTDVLLGALWPQ